MTGWQGRNPGPPSLSAPQLHCDGPRFVEYTHYRQIVAERAAKVMALRMHKCDMLGEVWISLPAEKWKSEDR